MFSWTTAHAFIIIIVTIIIYVLIIYTDVLFPLCRVLNLRTYCKKLAIETRK